MSNKVILEEAIEFETQEYSYHDGTSEVVHYIKVYFGFEGEERNNVILIVSENFKNWLRTQANFIHVWKMSSLFAADNRKYLVVFVFDYLNKIAFQGDLVRDMGIQIKTITEREDYYVDEVKSLRDQVEQTEKQLELARLSIRQKDQEIRHLEKRVYELTNSNIKKAS